MNAKSHPSLYRVSGREPGVIEFYELYPVAGFICLVSYLAAALVR